MRAFLASLSVEVSERMPRNWVLPEIASATTKRSIANAKSDPRYADASALA
jgi:hypothetical protein